MAEGGCATTGRRVLARGTGRNVRGRLTTESNKPTSVNVRLKLGTLRKRGLVRQDGDSYVLTRKHARRFYLRSVRRVANARGAGVKSRFVV